MCSTVEDLCPTRIAPCRHGWTQPLIDLSLDLFVLFSSLSLKGTTTIYCSWSLYTVALGHCTGREYWGWIVACRDQYVDQQCFNHGRRPAAGDVMWWCTTRLIPYIFAGIELKEKDTWHCKGGQVGYIHIYMVLVIYYYTHIYIYHTTPWSRCTCITKIPHHSIISCLQNVPTHVHARVVICTTCPPMPAIAIASCALVDQPPCEGILIIVFHVGLWMYMYVQGVVLLLLAPLLWRKNKLVGRKIILVF